MGLWVTPYLPTNKWNYSWWMKLAASWSNTVYLYEKSSLCKSMLGSSDNWNPETWINLHPVQIKQNIRRLVQHSSQDSAYERTINGPVLPVWRWNIDKSITWVCKAEISCNLWYIKHNRSEATVLCWRQFKLQSQKEKETGLTCRVLDQIPVPVLCKMMPEVRWLGCSSWTS